MYFEYLREREPDTKILEKEYGFALYLEMSYDDERAIYIQDIFVLPEYRKQDKASEMSLEIQEIAKSMDIKYLLGSVVPSANHSNRSLQVLMAHGMKLVSADNDLIWLKKEII
jgi:ribosomal protein S18 acetylase RimI-like enzyme